MRPDSQATIGSINAVEKSAGPEAALNLLQEQYNNFAKTHGGITSRDLSLYWNAVAQGLESRGIFDELAIVWGKQHMNAYTDRFSRGNLRVMHNEAPTFMDQDMTGSLLRQFKDKDPVTRDDLGQREQSIQGEHQARAVISRLLESVDGTAENTLFAKIDRTNKIDGKIGIADINDYVQRKTDEKNHHVFDYMQPMQRDQELRDLDYAVRLQKNWDTDPEILKLRGVSCYEKEDSRQPGTAVYNSYLTLDNLARAGAYEGRFDMLRHAISSPQSKPADAALRTSVPIQPVTDTAQPPAGANPAPETRPVDAQAQLLDETRRERANERAVDHRVRQANTHIVQKGETWVSIAREALKNDPSCHFTVAQKVDELRHLNSYDFRTGLYKGSKGSMPARDIIKPKQRLTLYSEAELDRQIEAGLNNGH